MALFVGGDVKNGCAQWFKNVQSFIFCHNTRKPTHILILQTNKQLTK